MRPVRPLFNQSNCSQRPIADVGMGEELPFARAKPAVSSRLDSSRCQGRCRVTNPAARPGMRLARGQAQRGKRGLRLRDFERCLGNTVRCVGGQVLTNGCSRRCRQCAPFWPPRSGCGSHQKVMFQSLSFQFAQFDFSCSQHQRFKLREPEAWRGFQVPQAAGTGAVRRQASRDRPLSQLRPARPVP